MAAFRGSFSRAFAIRARVVRRRTPLRTRDTDKKKQRSEFHIHIAMLYIHNPGGHYNRLARQAEKTYLRLE